jgi:hypothetical protein
MPNARFLKADTTIKSSVFDDLAHQIVHQTTLSLHNAAALITPKLTLSDSQLFLIKHLLLLKSQIVAFDIEYVTPEIGFDFSSATQTFWELRERGGLFNPINLVKGMGNLLPRVVENMLDAKGELDGRLRTVINDFVVGFANRMTSDISDSSTKKRSFDGAGAVQAVRTAIEKEAPMLRRKLDEYLYDHRTKETLIGAIQDQVIQNYEDFYECHSSKAEVGRRHSRKKGKGREDDVWDPDAFADWTISIFKVDGAGFRDTYERSQS